MSGSTSIHASMEGKSPAMVSVQDHYEHLLADHYTWMFGVSFSEKVAEQKALLDEAGASAPGVAVDLGCGSGFQSIALAELGADRVHAFDTSRALLAELKGHARGKPITTYDTDLMAFDELITTEPNTIICMGDTLTHLPSREDVAALFRKIGEALSKSGQFVLSYRDLSASPTGLERFIPVHSSDDRIMICFLEDAGDTVLVHDLVQVRDATGWALQKSAYPKLKLPLEGIKEQLAEVGLTVTYEQTHRGMIVLSAAR